MTLGDILTWLAESSGPYIMAGIAGVFIVMVAFVCVEMWCHSRKQPVDLPPPTNTVVEDYWESSLSISEKPWDPTFIWGSECDDIRNSFVTAKKRPEYYLETAESVKPTKVTKAPNTLDELLKVLPGLRMQRSMPAKWLGILLARKPGQCVWCGKPGKAVNEHFCSKKCAKAFNLRCNDTYQQKHVFARDKLICQICGCKTIQHKGNMSESDPRLSGVESRKATIDHKLPVSQGGGLCGPDNLQVVCEKCHREKTAEYNRSTRSGCRRAC